MGKPTGNALEVPLLPSGPTPPEGRSALYPKSDGRWYAKDNLGAEEPIGREIEVSTTAPSNPVTGEFWLHPSAGGPSPQANFHVGPTDPGFVTPGMWIQIGMGEDGKGVTLWVEDGT